MNKKEPQDTLLGLPCYSSEDYYAYLDDTAEPTCRMEMSEHVAQCTRCRLELMRIESAIKAETQPMPEEKLARFNQIQERVRRRLFGPVSAREKPLPIRLADAIQQAEREQIVSLLKTPLDELYALVGYASPAAIGEQFHTTEATQEGRRSVRELLDKHRDTLDGHYDRLKELPVALDETLLTANLADAIASFAGRVPPLTLAALVVRERRLDALE